MKRRLFLKILAGTAAIFSFAPIFEKLCSRLPRLNLASNPRTAKASDRLNDSNVPTRKRPIKPLPEPSQRTRVVCVSNIKATSWDYSTGYYVEYINQDAIDRMLDKGLMELTGKDNVSSAWQNIMKAYKPGDTVALKPNFNCADKDYQRFCQEIMTAPQVINAVIKGLTEHLKVPEKDIYIYDLCRPIPQSLIRKYIPYKVNYVQIPGSKITDRVKTKLKIGLNAPDTSAPIEMREKITDQNGNLITCYMPRLLTNAQHLINLPVVKLHQWGVITGPFKNHFGTVRFSNLGLYPVYLHGDVMRKSIVDLNRNTHIKDKTRLVIADFLFGSYNYKSLEYNTQVKEKWDTLPQGQTPNSLLISRDPVAVESVMYHYVMKERSHRALSTYSDDYLRDAMAHNLGVHEAKKSSDDFRLIQFTQTTV